VFFFRNFYVVHSIGGEGGFFFFFYGERMFVVESKAVCVFEIAQTTTRILLPVVLFAPL
jgi:hypothetical protein